MRSPSLGASTGMWISPTGGKRHDQRDRAICGECRSGLGAEGCESGKQCKRCERYFLEHGKWSKKALGGAGSGSSIGGGRPCAGVDAGFGKSALSGWSGYSS